MKIHDIDILCITIYQSIIYQLQYTLKTDKRLSQTLKQIKVKQPARTFFVRLGQSKGKFLLEKRMYREVIQPKLP